MFECFLFAPVHDVESAAEIGNGAAVFKLRKVDAVMWPSLQSVGTGKLFIVLIYTCSLLLFIRFSSDLNALQNHGILRFVVRMISARFICGKVVYAFSWHRHCDLRLHNTSPLHL